MTSFSLTYWADGIPIESVKKFENGGMKYWTMGAIYSPLTSINRYTLYTTSDSSDGTWTNNASGGELFSALDEISVDDSDYIKSSSYPLDDICKIKLGSPPYTVIEPMVVSYRFARGGNDTSPNGVLRVRLLQGTTEIASWTESDLISSYVQRDRTLSNAQFATITDFNDLYIEFKANTA